MADVEVLVLHGSPGSGKTTLARSIAEHLRRIDVANAVIDPDDLSLVYPHQDRAFSLENLRAIWPSYAAIGGLRAIVPTVVADVDHLHELRDALPASRFFVCELVAPTSVLRQRVFDREPNAYWQRRLAEFVAMYHARTDLDDIRDFKVSTHGYVISDSARAILKLAAWDA
jgi:adenylylsulfate kinase-like enzyme